MKKTLLKTTLIALLAICVFTENQAQTISGPIAVINQTYSYNLINMPARSYYHVQIFGGTFSDGTIYKRFGSRNAAFNVTWGDKCYDQLAATITIEASNNYFTNFAAPTTTGVFLNTVAFSNPGPCNVNDPCTGIKNQINAILNNISLSPATKINRIRSIVN